MTARRRVGLPAAGRQLALLVALNAVVGALVGLERSVLPGLGEHTFGLGSTSAVLSFLVGFGAAKALANLTAGALADRYGRRVVLIAGWVCALPAAVLVGVAPTWAYVVAANVFLGASQGFAWSMTVLMKIDLVGAGRRGLAVGMNESAGYLGVALAAVSTGALAGTFAPRTMIWVGTVALAGAGLLVTLMFVRDTAAHPTAGRAPVPMPIALPVAAQAGFVTNLNDALAWGLLPLYLAAHGASGAEIGTVAGIYPAVWGSAQLLSGPLSDRVGRRRPIAAGMLLQGGALAAIVVTGGDLPAAMAAAGLLGLGTALCYPVLLAAVADAAWGSRRGRALGVYRFWRDSGLVAGALVAGILADAFGADVAIVAVAALTAASGLVVGFPLRRALRSPAGPVGLRRGPSMGSAVRR